MSVEEAREKWFALVKEAQAGNRTRIVHGKDDSLVVLLGPVSELAARCPAVTVTVARPELMTLMEAAMTSGPQILTRSGKPAAVLMAPDGGGPRPAGASPPSSRLVSLGDVLAEPSRPLLSFGLPGLDEITAGLLEPRLTLLASAPDAGGGLLAAALARHTALTAGQAVLYGVSGLASKDVVASRMIAAEAGANYAEMRSGSLPAEQQERVDQARKRLAASLLWFDDGAGDPLTVDMIAETARYADGLALIVVDRLQQRAQTGVPLSGRALPAAAERLAQVAAELSVPVVAVLDTDDGQTTGGLHPHLTLSLTRTGTQAQVVVQEAGVGAVATVPLFADLPCVRFTEPAAVRQGSPRPPSGLVVAPAEAAVPRWAPADTAPRPAAAAAQTVNGSGKQGATSPAPRPAQNTPPRALAAVSVPGTAPADESAGERLVRLAGVNPQLKPEDFDVLELLGERIDDHLAHVQGDLEKAATRMQGQAITDVMDLFNKSRVGGRRQHTANPPSYDFLKKERPRGVDQVWEGRHKWVNTVLLEEILKGGPASVPVIVLDTPGAYLNAFNLWLPQGKLLHRRHDPDNLDDGFPGPKTSSGIFLAEPSPWEHTHLPNPLGSRREPGPLLLDTATVKTLIDCHRKHDLCGPPRILESWTSSGSETFLLKLRRVLNAARLAAREQEELDIVEKYIKAMYSKFSSTLGESTSNRQIKRPDWMHTVRSQAFANLWLRAFKLHQAGLTIVKVMGTDEIHVAGEGDWRDVFEEGHQLSQMKTKGKDAYTLTPRNARRHYPQD
ncbi:type II toxin-antitoxin system prevent-host-death family antitoxin [Streptomyces nodosus]|uniref:type II toxin-antitoxin system prevent-host-death family antitoxin n=1 Tax=Streptomyces nodosus TaxID=40318 RepID=UPI003453E67D